MEADPPLPTPHWEGGLGSYPNPHSSWSSWVHFLRLRRSLALGFWPACTFCCSTSSCEFSEPPPLVENEGRACLGSQSNKVSIQDAILVLETQCWRVSHSGSPYIWVGAGSAAHTSGLCLVPGPCCARDGMSVLTGLLELGTAEWGLQPYLGTGEDAG